MRRKFYIFLPTLFICLVLLSSLANATTYYVTTTGSDTNGCTNNTTDACLTIQHALTVVAATGDTILVGPGTYNQGSTIDFGPGKNVILQGSGLQGDNLTRLVSPSMTNLFIFNDGESNASIVKNFILESNGSTQTTLSASSFPIIENNIIIPHGGNGIFSVTGAGSLLVQNNIILYANAGVSCFGSNGVINNTVLQASGTAFNSCVRTNNVAFGGNNGFSSCTLSTCVNNDAFGNTTDYVSGSGTAGLTDSPLFFEMASGTSAALTSSTLQATGAAWTTNQWAGFFVTPNVNRTVGSSTVPAYFLIVSNTSNTLTTATAGNAGDDMTTFGSVGNTFAITTLSPGSNSNILGAGTSVMSGAPDIDLYGNTRPYPTSDTGVDIGAVEYSPEPAISINDASAAKGSPVTFTVSLANSYGLTVTVNYSTANGTAIDGVNYSATSGTLTFIPGVTSQNIVVETLTPPGNEGNKTFFVNLSSPVNGTLGTSQGIGTITDSSPPPSGSVTITVPAGNTVTVGSNGASVTLESSTDIANPTYLWEIISSSTGNLANAGTILNPTSATAIYQAPPNAISQTVTIKLTVTGAETSTGVGNKTVQASTTTASTTTALQINGPQPIEGGSCSLSKSAGKMNLGMMGVFLLQMLFLLCFRKVKLLGKNIQ